MPSRSPKPGAELPFRLPPATPALSTSLRDSSVKRPEWRAQLVAHFEFTRINIEPIILTNKFEERLIVGGG